MTDIDTSTDIPEAEPALPRIAGYRISRRLGLGGMAAVYLALQESLDREVAIKVMRPTRQLDEEQSTRFEHEARIIARLEHPSIVVIHEVGRTEEGDLYYVMPYLAKGDLSVRDFRDDDAGLIDLLHALLDALGYAHTRGIVHRDVKAENVLFDNADRPQLADFGIALAQREVNSRITGDGLVIGTSAQMSPEQARADTIDGRSDLYSLGVLTYEQLTGELPFRSTDPLSLALMHAQDPIPRLPAEKAHWQAFIDCAMAKRPEQRFRNAQAMQRALDPIRRHVRRSAAPIGRIRRAMSTQPPLLIGVGLLLAVSLISLSLPYLTQMSTRLADSAGIQPDSAVAATTAGENKTLAELEALARQQVSIGALTTPTGANAAETWLVMLKRDPSNRSAITGIESVITASTPALLDAVSEGDADDLRKRYLKLELVADMAGIRNNEAFKNLRAKLGQALLVRIASLADAGDRESALQSMRLAQETGIDKTTLQTLDSRLQALPEIGKPVRDGGGKEFMYVPASINGARIGKAFMMMRNEVSRADYARFASRTNRDSSRCRISLSPLRILDRRSWDDPGFRQTASEPVVCVSFEDARAYASWLSRNHGHTYRLPTRSEWLHAARSTPRNHSACALGNIRDRSATGKGSRFSCNDGYANTSPSGKFRASTLGLNDLRGNVAEWTSSCTSETAGKCTRRGAAGLSWQDGPDIADSRLRDLPTSRGYDDVGFRLVRDP
ncbi:MAG TPA: bifunctional serine/threonine-protein kinase/formylglycine-generating enzyme family protein [Dokdonella sp.]|uniref:bifunctional serine/threonine-protein kinase/formylglycine-generating enzyme family protein n=1 Tax=Dokdonella sp. TaxID=2291710 RepID=UPI002D7FEE88|nr:bifunctional serine/threonine-protein kinase/formylglycine-generating enzyme family protein [Dokdonella sp.]HET9034001.1 bifunctional serine/threonine-protein kinase/formylglycine-generating enzyme family protein [Dokdonella sp.]